MAPPDRRGFRERSDSRPWRSWALPLLISLACSAGPGQSGGAAGIGAGGSSSGGQPAKAGADGANGGATALGGSAGTAQAAGSTGAGGGAGVAGAAGGTGVAGSGGIAGAAGSAGVGGAAGSFGVAGAKGSTGQGGQAGLGTPASCTFTIQDALSAAIPTVGVVTWSTDLAGLSDASIEFTLDDPAAAETNLGSGGPIDVSGQTHRALLLGLKPGRPYTYRIVARSGNTVCVSPDRSLTTGALGADGPTIMRTVTAPVGSAPAQGFIVTTDYGSSTAVYIFDADGDIVWRADGPIPCSRARMDWEGANMWMLEADGTQGSAGDVRRISMDGTDVLDHVTGLDQAHHDLTVLPGGIVATLVWTGEASQASTLVERSPDGTLTTVARIDESVFPPSGLATYHANSVAYHAVDDTYTVGDLNAVGYVKLTRAGKPLWQFLASCQGAPGPKCATGDLDGNHGQHLLDDGSFLFFKARMIPSAVDEYSLTESASALSASEIWSYTPTSQGTIILGDVQRLPSGNTLITYSLAGEMLEISPAGTVVQTIDSLGQFASKRQFGYADFRPSLYGPPPR